MFLPALHAYAAVGFPDDHGELLRATDNVQPVLSMDVATYTTCTMRVGPCVQSAGP
jgi:hypothetical protein